MSDGQFIHITLALLAGGIIALYYIIVKPIIQLIRKWAKRNTKKEELSYKDNAMNEEDYQTRDLLIKTLEDIGCQYETDENNCIIFKYQGEEFKIDANNDRPIIWIYNVAWTGIGTNDTDADFLKQAVNKANENSAITNLYTINEEKGFIAAHCQMTTYFAYNIPNYRGYFKSILDSFFYAHQQVRNEFENLAKNQKQKERVEIKGFRNN